MRVYIAGKMRGVPQFGFPAFDAAEAMLRKQGHWVFNPAKHDRTALALNPEQFPNGEFSDAGWTAEQVTNFLRQAVSWDMSRICDSDAIALLPGWESSQGAMAELAVARLLGLGVIYL